MFESEQERTDEAQGTTEEAEGSLGADDPAEEGKEDTGNNDPSKEGGYPGGDTAPDDDAAIRAATLRLTTEEQSRLTPVQLW